MHLFTNKLCVNIYYLEWCYVLVSWRDTMEGDKTSEDYRRIGFQRCQEFLGGAWTLATIDQFRMEYIR